MWIVENSIHVWRKSSSSRLSMIQYVHLYCCEKARVLKCSLRRHKPRHPFPLQPLLSFTKIAPIWLLCCLLFGIRRTPCTLHRLHWTCLNSFPFIPQPHSLICIAFHYAQTKNIQHPQMTVSDISWCTVNVYVLACVCGFSICACRYDSIPVLGFVLQRALECFQHIDEMTSYHWSTLT